MSQHPFLPFTELKTKRLLLRKPTSEYEHDFSLLRSNEEAMRFVPRPPAKEVADVRPVLEMLDSLLQNETGIWWGIILPEKNQLIGSIGIFNYAKEHRRAEIGYMLLPEFQRQGIMQEAIEEVLKFAFHQMNLHTLAAITDPENQPSNQLLLKNKFVQEGHFKENYFFNGQFLDSFNFTLHRKNYTNS
ncbi:MAG: GNAT family N-acetyltransferase [Bacteroidia bacterium]